MKRRLAVSTRPLRLATWLVEVSLALILTGCATAGATWKSGVGDSFPEEPPYYAGEGVSALDAGIGRVGHLPVAYQRGGAQAPIFDPAHGGSMQALLAEMTAFLDSLALSQRLVSGGRVSAVTHQATLLPPDVRFGCTARTGEPDECDIDDDTVLGREGHRMHLAVGRPSRAWVSWMGEVMQEAGVDAVLVVTLEVGHHLVRQRGLLGRKELELGTGHVVSLPWLTSLETPVSVLQLTGALVGRDGRALRIGAEGLLANRTSMKVAALGGQALITDEDLGALLQARREDLPGSPSTWRVGLRTLVEQLLTSSGGGF